ncbi:HEPN domain-containing protein [Candidatus Woesearchaeota archaeon]|nr:HEPN domain-containing protein [Candidatus Woesearchaeota archaeon]
MQNKIKWCFGLKDGLKLIEPNEEIAISYLREAKTSLKRAEKNFEDGDLLWTTVVIYYAEYYSLYSFLQRIGIKCENHFCSILAIALLLGKDKTETINKHKSKRVDAQYYMKIGKKEEVKKMLQEAKRFVIGFDNFISNLTNNDIKFYGKQLKKLNNNK